MFNPVLWAYDTIETFPKCNEQEVSASQVHPRCANTHRLLGTGVWGDSIDHQGLVIEPESDCVTLEVCSTDNCVF